MFDVVSATLHYKHISWFRAMVKSVCSYVRILLCPVQFNEADENNTMTIVYCVLCYTLCTLVFIVYAFLF